MSNARHYRDRETVLQEVRRGDLCAILVEGEEQGSDAALLKFILREVTTEAIFFGRDGRSGVIVDLQALVPEMPTDRVFAIVDRDFENQQVVEQCFDPNFQGHVFVWRYFTIENYLLQSSWICETVQRLLWQNPNQTIPAEFQNEESVKRLLHELAKQFAPAVAGNATIANLTRQQKIRNVKIEGRSYFFEGTTETNLRKLISHYSPSSHLASDLFTNDKLEELFQSNLARIKAAIQSEEGLHECISGKMLLTAIHQKLLTEIPGYKIRHQNILENLMVLASKQVPRDLRLLVEDRILPRWRKARAASTA